MSEAEKNISETPAAENCPQSSENVNSEAEQDSQASTENGELENSSLERVAAASAESENLKVSETNILVPELGHELLIRPCAELKNWYRIEPKLGQKCIAFVVMFAQGIVLAFIALVFLFGADFVMDYSQRGMEFVAFFGKFFALATGFCAICVCLIQAMRNTPVFINPEQKRIVNAKKLTEKLASESADLRDVESVKVQTGILKRSTLIVCMGGQEIMLVDSFGDSEDLNSLVVWLNKIRV